MNDRIYLSPPYLTGREQKYVGRAFEENWVAPAGPDITAFETALADYAGRKYAVAVSSCTAAIHLVLLSLGIGRGDTVLCSTATFIGSCNPVRYVGAQPVFIDSESKSYGMSPAALEAALGALSEQNRLPKAAILVNLYGQVADMDALLPLLGRYGVPVIEDAAESLGAAYKGKKSGGFGAASVFSFNGNKIITTSGGGAVLTDDAQAAEKIRFLSTQAKEPVPYYEHKEVGYNYRISNISAAIGRGQLETLDERVHRKRAHYRAYGEALYGLPLRLMPVYPGSEPNYWLTCAVLDEGYAPEKLIEHMERSNIECRRFWKPMHLQAVHREFEYFTAGGADISKDLFERGICLPSGSGMTDLQRTFVIRTLREFFAEQPEGRPGGKR